MDEILKMNKQGRIVLPAHIRKIVGMKEEGKLLIKFGGSRIILEPYPKDLKKVLKNGLI